MTAYMGKKDWAEDNDNSVTVSHKVMNELKGVVPLSEGSLQSAQKEMSHQFNPSAAMAEASMSALRKHLCQAWETHHLYYPLAAMTATISLSTFRGSNFGFDTFCGTSKKLHIQDPSQFGDYRKHGNCRMTKSSYRKVHPIMAKASNNDYNCVPTIITTMAATAIATSLTSQPMLRKQLMTVAMSKASNIGYQCVSTLMTVIAQNLLSQPNLHEILMVVTIAFAANFPLGMSHEHSSCSPPLLTGILAVIPYMPIIANSVLMPKVAMVYTLGATVLGQVLGLMAEQHRLKAIADTHQ